MKKILFILLQLAIIPHVFAKDVIVQNALSGSQLSLGASLTTIDPEFLNMPSLAFNDENHKAYILLSTEGFSSVYTAAYTAEVTIDIIATDANNAAIINYTQTLSVDYSPTSALNQGKQLFLIPNAYKLECTITSVTILDDLGAVIPPPDNLVLSSVINVNRYYCNPLISYITNLSGNYNVSSDNLDIIWSIEPKSEATDLEWTWVSNLGIDAFGNAISITAINLDYNFKNNSSRVRIKKNKSNSSVYSIPLIYEQGYLVYRIRYVYIDCLDPNKESYSEWTIFESGTLNSITTPTSLTINNHYEHDEDHVKKLNWQSSAVFSEHGKRKDIVGYADGSLRNRQNVTKISSDNNVIVGETFYDFHGRKAVNTLPVPAVGDSIAYQYAFNKNTITEPYSWVDFDKDAPPPAIPPTTGESSCQSSASGMSTSSGSAKYYSSANPNQSNQQKFVPESNGFAYSQVEYTPDNTGRIRSEGGVGSALKLGTKRETKYFYGVPEQEELDVVFGTEVGFSNRYTKELVVDPNKQVSISFKDASGKVIATHLAGDSPDNLLSLPQNTLPSVTVETDLVNNATSTYNNLDYDAGTINLAKGILVDVAAIQEFKYEFTPVNYTDFCLSPGPVPPAVCLQCVYDLEISIKDECGEDRILSPVGGGQSTYIDIIENIGIVDTTCITPITFTKNFATDKLAVGNYTISKKLKVKQNPAFMDHYFKVYMNNNACDVSLQTFINEEFSDIDYSGCEDADPCELECNYKIEQQQQKQNNLSPGVFLVPIDFDDCVEACHNDVCGQYKEEMLEDVSPGGKYGARSAINFSGNPDPNWDYSVFNENNLLGIDKHWRRQNSLTGDFYDHYRHSDGQQAHINVIEIGFNSGNYLPELNSYNWNTVFPDGTEEAEFQTLTSVNVFLDNWESSFAESLLKHHPEYCFLDFCDENSSAMIYADKIGRINSYQEAAAKGYLQDTDLTADDLFLNDPLQISLATVTSILPTLMIGPPVTLLFLMANDLNSFNGMSLATSPGGTPLSVLDAAILNVYCPELDLSEPDTTAINSCIAAGLADFQTNECYQDAVWEFVKAEYIKLSNKYIALLKEQSSCNIDSSFLPDGSIFDQPNASATMDSMFNNGLLNQGSIDNINDSVFPPDSLTDWGEDLVYDQYTSQCEAYANNWMSVLDSCQYISTASANWADDSLELVLVLIDICAHGSAYPSNAFGATSVSPNNPVTNQGTDYYNFQDAIYDIVYNGTGPLQTYCTYDQIAFPPAYGNNFSADAIGSLDTCACNNLLEIKADYNDAVASGTLASGISTLSDFAIDRLGEDFTGLKQSFCECEEAFAISGPAWTSGATWTTAAVAELDSSTLFVPYTATCNSGCISCEDISEGLQDLLAIYGSPLSFVQDGPLIANYLNNKFNFNLGFIEYMSFFDSCGVYVNSTGSTWDSLIGIPGIGGTNPYAVTSTGVTVGVLASGNNTLGTFLNKGGNAVLNTNSKSNQAVKNFLNMAITGPVVANMQVNQQTQFCLANPPFKTNTVSQSIIYSLDATAIVSTGGGYYTIKVDSCYLRFYLDHYKHQIQSISNINLVSISATGSLFTMDVTCILPGNPVQVITHSGIDLFTNCDLTSIYSGGPFTTGLGAASPPELCNSNLIDNIISEDPCVAYLEAIATQNAISTYNEYMVEMVDTFRAAYIGQCMKAYTNETFTRTYKSLPYQYTLYYYDQAGNLVKTIPPKGVDSLDALQMIDAYQNRINGGAAVVPSHKLATMYKYNSLNQLVEQQTPDGGKTTFYYDFAGQIVASQNAKQKLQYPKQYSYSRYDDLGRVVETGALATTAAMNKFLARNPLGFNNWYNNAAKFEVTITQYDDSYHPAVNAYFGVQGQENLRGRVVSVFHYEGDYAGIYDFASHYSYDIAGNVKTLIQEQRRLTALQQELKRIDYEYDLISGNVNKVIYQKDKVDQFIHKYIYDADNRLLTVNTSPDGIIWDRDASYKYYEHGPLARVELGQQRVQGLDYAYTLQGWLKGVNANELDPAKDMGNDGLSNAVAKDVFAFDLGYFSGDYVPIGGTGLTEDLDDITSAAFSYSTNLSLSLYNGNIRYMTTALRDQTNTPLNLNLSLYNYDQLNRIRESHSYIGDNDPVNTGANDFVNLNSSTDYYTAYNYDKNGNIDVLERNGNSTSMDDLDYTYYANTNKLSHVDDGVSAGSYTTDIDSQNAGNYNYDAIGNLVSDVTEEIVNIKWANSGKVKSITRIAGSNMPDLAFSYDGMGNRILKIVKPKDTLGVLLTQEKWVFTHYVRDAQGNIMATYEQNWLTGPIINNMASFTENYILKEHVLYGSSRLGVHKIDTALIQGLHLFSTTLSSTSPYLGNTDTTNNHGGTDKPNESINYNDDGSFSPFHTFSIGSNSSSTTTNASVSSLRTYVRGEKIYELSNHLGNVMATVSDKALPIDNDADGVIDFYNADLLSYSDYYPFGSLKPSINASTSNYRFGFGGHEKDDDVKSVAGSHLSFGDYGYDPRTGRRWRPDPLQNGMPAITPYAYAFNNPTMFVDEDGKWPGVTFMYFELDLGAGFAYGWNYIRQSGVARDEVGKTHFIMQSNVTINPERDGSLLIGGGVSATAALRQSWKAETFKGLSRYNLPTTTIDASGGFGGTIGFGDSEVTIGGSFGFDAGIQVGLTEIVESISLTYDEANIVNDRSSGNLSWRVTNITEEPNENGFFEGSVTIDVGKDQRVTDQKVLSVDGKQWESESYTKEAIQAEKEDK